jgi:pyruvate dehydrogenase E1 component beta subunit
MVPTVLEVADKLSKEEGFEIEVVDPRTLMPLDKEIIVNSVKKTGKAMVIHEAVQTGGYGGEIAAVIADSEAFFYLDAPIRRLGGLDVPIPYNPELERNAVPTAEKIEANIRELLK